MLKRSSSITITTLSAVSALVLTACAPEGEAVTAACVDTTSIVDNAYRVADDRFCDGGSHSGYVYVYGGSYSGGYVRGGTTVRPRGVGINTRSGKTIVRGGFGSGGKSGGGG